MSIFLEVTRCKGQTDFIFINMIEDKSFTIKGYLLLIKEAVKNRTKEEVNFFRDRNNCIQVIFIKYIEQGEASLKKNP